MIARSPNIVAVTLLCGLVATTAFAQSTDPLPSWNEGPTKQSIMAFVAKVTRAGSPDFVPAAERSRRSTTTARYGPNSPSTSRFSSPSIA